MSFWEAIFLGAVQGLTEFLPVSSSGHLVIFQHLFGYTEPELLFDVCVHAGTLLAVLAVFRKEVLETIPGAWRLVLMALGKKPRTLSEDPGAAMALGIIVGTLPTGLIGVGFHEAGGWIFASMRLASFCLLATAAILWATRWAGEGDKPITAKNALLVGIIQGLSVLPGISRSGSTISAGLFLGLDRALAARFSFLLSIPAILGALVLELSGGGSQGSASLPVLVLGGAVAGATGFAALKALLRFVDRGRLHWFAPYCLFMGLLGLLLSAGA